MISRQQLYLGEIVPGVVIKVTTVYAVSGTSRLAP